MSLDICGRKEIEFGQISPRRAAIYTEQMGLAMAQPQHFIGFFTLGYIVSAFSTCAFFLLRYHQKPLGEALSHTFAYWIVTALLMLDTWHLVGWTDGPFAVYRKYRYIRKPVAFIAFPTGVAISTIGFHRLIEGHVPNEGVLWFLSIVLWIVAAFHGIVSPRERPHAESTSHDLDQARQINKASWYALLGLLGLIAGSGLASDLVQSFMSQIVRDSNLIGASIVLVISIGITFGVQPWLTVRQIQGHVDPEPKKTN